MKTLQTSLLFMLFPLLASGQQSKSLFLDNGYRTDSVTISGQVINRTTQTQPRIAYTHFITEETTKIPIQVDSSGYFSVKLPVYNTTQLYIHYLTNGTLLSLFAEPGEKIVIHSDWKDNKVTFKGTRAQDHQQVFEYDSYLSSLNRAYFDPNRSEKTTHEQFLERLKQYAYQNDSILADYLKRHPKTSKKAKQEIQVKILNETAFNLMQRRFELNRREGEKFSKTYMDYADSIFAALPQPYTIVSNSFLRDYLDYYAETKQKTSTFRQALVNYAIQEKMIQPTEEQLKDINLILTSKEFQPILSEAFNALKQTDQYTRIMLDYYNGGALIRPMPTILKELVTTQAFYRYLNDNRIALSPSNLNYYKQQVSNPQIQKFVFDYQQKLEDLTNREIDDVTCLKEITPFKDCKTGEELFAKLVEPYKGKIIYLDVWGTWCGPCKMEMKYTGEIKKAMQGKEVVFMYLANGSPDMSWKNVIKEMHLTGKQVAHYNFPTNQQNLLENHLNVRHYPTYIFIDREGKIVEQKAKLRPSSGQELINYLNELLAK